MRGKLIAVLVMMAMVGVGWWAVNSFTSQDSFQIALAFGIPQGNEIELHVVASMGMTAREPPRRDLSTGKVLWQEWVDRHFDLRDASQASIPFAFRQSTDVIPINQLVGTPEGYLLAKVKKGVQYTFDYYPRVGDLKCYRHTFTAPAGDVPVARILFEPA